MVTAAGTCNVFVSLLVSVITTPLELRGKLFTDTVPVMDCPPTTEGKAYVTAETLTTGAGLSTTDVLSVTPLKVAVIGTVVAVCSRTIWSFGVYHLLTGIVVPAGLSAPSTEIVIGTSPSDTDDGKRILS